MQLHSSFFRPQVSSRHRQSYILFQSEVSIDNLGQQWLIYLYQQCQLSRLHDLFYIALIIQQQISIMQMKVRSGSEDDFTHDFIPYKKIKLDKYLSVYKHQQPPLRRFKNQVYRYIRKEHNSLNPYEINEGLAKKTSLPIIKQTTKKNRMKTENLYLQNRQASHSFVSKASKLANNLEQMRKKSASMNHSFKQFHQKLNRNKHQLFILQQFNQLASKYIDQTPADITEETRETVRANRAFLEEFKGMAKYPHLNIQQNMERNHQIQVAASQFKKYSEPQINKKLRDHIMNKNKKLKLKYSEKKRN